MLVELIGGGILEITSDSWASSGCETCDYGSSYVNEFDIKLTSGTLNIEVDAMYEYDLSEGSMMEIILPNVDEIKKMNEDAFIEWIKVKTTKKANEGFGDTESVKFSFKAN